MGLKSALAACPRQQGRRPLTRPPALPAVLYPFLQLCYADKYGRSRGLRHAGPSGRVAGVGRRSRDRSGQRRCRVSVNVLAARRPGVPGEREPLTLVSAGYSQDR